MPFKTSDTTVVRVFGIDDESVEVVRRTRTQLTGRGPRRECAHTAD